MTVAPRTPGAGVRKPPREMLWGGGEDIASIVADLNRWSAPMQKLNDLSRSLTPLDPDGTLIAVIEMSLSSWLVAGIVPGVERQPLKKLAVDESALLKLLHRWREEAEKAGHGSNASLSPSRPAATASGWRAGSGHATSRPTSFTLRAWRCRASIGAPRPIGSIPSCSNAPFSAGCAASVITARWWRSRQPRTKMPSGPTASARASSESKVGSSTE